MKFTITLNHLKKAIVQKQAYATCLKTTEVCPVAQALRDKFPLKRVQVWGNKILIGGILRKTTPNALKVISLFDAKKYDELRNLLPISFVLPDLG